MSHTRNFLVAASLGFAVWTAPAMAQSPKPPPFRPPGSNAPVGTPKPPPFRPKPSPPSVQPVKPIPPVTVIPTPPGNGLTPMPDDEQQRRRRLFILMMLRQQALTRAALQQAALAAAFASQSPYQAAVPSYSSSYSAPYPSPTPMAPMAKEQRGPEVALLAGIVDAEGKIAWPLGLQIARPALETKTLRERIDGLVRVAAKQAAYGQVQRGILDEAKQLVAELRKNFDDSRQDMPERTARDAEEFLARLNTSLQSMQAGERPAAYDDAGKKSDVAGKKKY